MNLERAVERANSASTERQAAELYNSIEHELAFSDNEDAYDQGEQALSVLESRYPGVEQEARQVTRPPQLSRSAGANMHGGRARSPLQAQTRRQHAARRRTASGTRARVASATAIHARPRSSGGSRRFQQTGIPGAAESVAQLTMRTIGWIAGLSFLYLMVTPKGSNAVSLFFGGATKAFRGFASPTVDPLNSSTWAAGTAASTKRGPGALATAGSTAHNAFNSVAHTAHNAGAATAGIRAASHQIAATVNAIEHFGGATKTHAGGHR